MGYPTCRKKPSLYQDETCFFCGSPYTVTHHIYPGNGRRNISDTEGCTVKLCNEHHNLGRHSVHQDREMDLYLRMDCQKRWEEREGIEDTEHEEFIATFGRNYL